MIKAGLFGLGTVGRGLVEIVRTGNYAIEIVGIVDRSYAKKEIHKLFYFLGNWEFIENIIVGSYRDHDGMLVSTQYRILFIRKGFAGWISPKIIDYKKIKSVELNTGPFKDIINIQEINSIISIDNVDKSAAEKFVEYIHDRLSL